MIEIKDFYAQWCTPCKRVFPILEEIANKYPEIKITKVDIEKEVDEVTKYKVKGVPSVFFEKDGEIVDKIIGGSPASEYFKIIERLNGNQ